MKTSGAKASGETTLRSGALAGVPPLAEAPTTPASAGPTSRPDPEVAAKPVRRRFTAEYKLQVLREADACEESGQLGALLRREGLYSSHLTDWRRQRELGTLAALTPKKRGRPGRHPQARRVAELERENARLRRRLEQAETIIEVQKKVSALLGSSPLTPPESGERS